MYIHEEHNYGFIAHPRTASSATQRVMRENGCRLYGNHHEVKEEWCRPILDSGGFIISTVRNPFDLFVSWYFHYHQRHGQPGQKQFKDKNDPPPMRPFPEWLRWIINNPNGYMQDGIFFGAKWTNRPLRYETLQQDYDAVMLEMGLFPTPIVPFNVSHKRKKKPYQHFYDSVTIKLIRDNFATELREHGYEYEEIPDAAPE
jgi:hypothetical protein